LRIDANAYPEVSAYISILDDEKKPTTGVSAAQVVVKEDANTVADFDFLPSTLLDGGIGLVLAIDNSGSMKDDDRYLEVQYALKQFIRELNPKDRVAVVLFGDSVSVGAGLTNDAEVLWASVENMDFGTKDTRLYDGINEAIRMGSGLSLSRRAVIVLTDGSDVGSHLTQDDCIEIANNLEMPVYTVGFGEKSKISEQPLGRIALLTGASYTYATTSGDLAELYTSVTQRLRNQYVLSYTSSLPGDGQWRELLLTLTMDATELAEKRNFRVPLIERPFTDYLYGGGVTAGAIIAGIATLLIAKNRRAAQTRNDTESSKPMSSASATQESSAPSPGFPTEVSRGAIGVESPSSSTQVIPDRGNVSDETNDRHTRILQQESVAMAWLIEKGGSRPGRDHQLKEGRNSIGRQGQNDIVIEDDYASREHAVVVSRDGNFELQDLVSTHGTLLNGEKVVHGVLTDGDEIVVGKTTLVFKEVI
jgi:VWFA-related protein